MYPIKSRPEQGFTLIELLLYVVVVSSLLLAVSGFFVLATEARIKNQAVAEVNQQGIAAMEYITQTLRNATDVTSPAPAASAATLSAVVPTASLSPAQFSLSGTALQVKEGAAATITLTSDEVQISSLSFTNLARAGTPDVIRVSFIISRANPNNRTEYNYQKTFKTTVSRRQP